MHHTNYYGDIGVAKIIEDLLKKDYVVSLPFITGHSKYDLIAEKNGVCYKIQCKYSSDGVWSNKNYKKEDLDYFAIYLSKIDKIVYPSFDFVGKTIAAEVPNSPTPFYWWEDFINFTNINDAKKRTFREFGKILTKTKTTEKIDSSIRLRKIDWPSKEELEKLVWEMPTIKLAEMLSVTDKSIARWCKLYNISKPPRGYWKKLEFGKTEKVVK